MIALAAEATGFGFMHHGYWYPGALGQVSLLFVSTIFFTFLGSFWFGLAFKQRPMRVWMDGALKATLAWMVTIVGAVLIPIKLYEIGVGALQNKVVGGMTISPFMAESLSGSVTFGMSIVALILIVAFFYTKAASWFLKYE